ncbi:BON domain-containing protein [Phreatobacter stygius]|uniref:BON domain-containing protein n=2 Tax=Phreatobacter stygius TaxID=1940610 RepID=A0A4D7BEH5_9HYPH|nr:BON domain-containing protein [Phreatobacter stygius]
MAPTGDAGPDRSDETCGRSPLGVAVRGWRRRHCAPAGLAMSRGDAIRRRGNWDMFRPKQWIWGLPPLALLVLLAIAFTEAPVTADVGKRSALNWLAKGSTGQGRGDRPRYQDDGQAESLEAQALAARAAAEVAGARLVDNATSIIAVRQPYLWTADKAGEVITLTGVVPSEASRGQIIAQARRLTGGAEVVDRLELARGAPDGFADATALLLRELGRLEQGRAALSDLKISLQGTANTTEVISSVSQAIGAPPAGFSVAEITIRPPRATPYLFEAERDPSGLALSGHVPNEATRASVLAMARQVLPGVAITDRMTLAEGAPSGYEAMTGFALAQLGRLSAGRVSLRDGALALRGAAPDGATYAAVTRAVRSGLPAVLSSATATITAPVIAPYRFSVIRQGDTIAVGGFIPDENVRADVLAAIRAAAPTLTIADRAEIGLGAPQGFQPMAAFVAGQAARLDPASALLADTALTIQGRAGTFAVLDAVTAMLRQPPTGLTVARIDLVPPTVRPFTWAARLDGADVVLEGHVPSTGVRDQVLARARSIASNAKVVDRMRVAEGASADFAAAALFGLGQLQRLKDGAVSLSDGSFAITGTGRDTVGAAEVAAAASGPQGLPRSARIVQNDVVATILSARPFLLNIIRTAQGVTLDGFAASEADKTALVEAARATLPGVTVTDKIRVAEGQPADMDWVAAGRFALMQVARLRQGSARYQDQAFTIEGDAIDRPGFVAANQAVRTEPFPNGGRLAGVDIRPPVVSPYPWFVQKTESGVLLQGFVPSNTLRQANREAAERIFAPLAVRDSQELAAGAPDGFAQVALFAMAQVARLAEGRASILDRTLRVAGRASSEAVANDIRGQLPPAGPEGFATHHELIGPVAPPAGLAPAPSSNPCAVQIREILTTGSVAFRPDSDAIRPDSLAVLTRIARSLGQCPAAAFIVEGHTDDTGSAERNLDLSQARALSVVKYLIRRGVPAARLTAQGFGQTRPVVPNDSAANRAKNRRIDFVVRP